MNPRHLLLAACALAAMAPALAQYQWIDAGGGHVFSDQPPPISVPEKNIISAPNRRGGSTPRDDVADGAAGEEAPAAPAVPTVRPGKTALEKKVEAEDAKRKAVEEKQRAQTAAAHADNCKRAQDYKRALDSGMRMAQVNEKGERIVLDDAARAAEMKRAQAAIADNCNG